MPHLTYSESDVGSTLHQRNAKTTYIGPGNFFFSQQQIAYLCTMLPLSLTPKKKLTDSPMDLNSGMLDGWETRVADSFNGLRGAESPFLFVLFCWLVFFPDQYWSFNGQTSIGAEGRFYNSDQYTQKAPFICVFRGLIMETQH